MKSIKKCLELIDIDEMKQEVVIRHKLRSQMVGQLYPSIIYDEIIVINKKIKGENESTR